MGQEILLPLRFGKIATGSSEFILPWMRDNLSSCFAWLAKTKEQDGSYSS
jgi:hypothetical protein